MKPSSDDSAHDLPDQLEVSPEGVDLSLIRWMLSLPPLERLNVLQDFADGALALRDGRVEE